MTRTAAQLSRRNALLLPAAGTFLLLMGAARAEAGIEKPVAPAKAPESGRSEAKAASRKAPAKTWEKVDGVSSASERRRARKERREKKKARKAAEGS